jgi:hypothetical protein
MSRADLLDEAKREADRAAGRLAPDHRLVSDRLHHMPAVLAEDRANVGKKGTGEVGRLLIAVSLGERRESREIGKHERVLTHPRIAP